MMNKYLKNIGKTRIATIFFALIIMSCLFMTKSPRDIVLDKASDAKKFEYSRTVNYRGINTYQVKITDIDSDYFILKHIEGKPEARLINKHVCSNGDVFYNYYEDYFLGIKVRTVLINKAMKHEDIALYESNLFKN